MSYLRVLKPDDSDCESNAVESLLNAIMYGTEDDVKESKIRFSIGKYYLSAKMIEEDGVAPDEIDLVVEDKDGEYIQSIAVFRGDGLGNVRCDLDTDPDGEYSTEWRTIEVLKK